MSQENLTIALVSIVALGVCSQWLARQLRIPAIAMLTIAGLIAGPGLGWIRPSEIFGPLLQPLIELSVALVLFEAGLNLKFSELKGTATAVKRLVSVGVAVAFVLTVLITVFIGALGWQVALIFGALAVISGPTVINPLLREVPIRERLSTCLKWEGAANDPIGVFLAVVVYHHLPSSEFGYRWSHLALGISILIGVTVLFGVVGGRLTAFALKKAIFPRELRSAFILATVLVIYVTATSIHDGAGLAAVTALGVYFSNRGVVGLKELRLIHEYVTVFLISVLFVTVSANVSEAAILDMNWHIVGVIALLVLVVRPVTVILSTIGAGLTWSERLFLGSVGPRGIVAVSMAAIYSVGLARRGYDDAQYLLTMMLGLSLVSVIVSGFSMRWLSRKLNLLKNSAK